MAIVSSTGTTHSDFADTSQWAIAWRRFRRQRRGLFGLSALLLVVLGVIFVPVFTSFESPNAITSSQSVATPASPNPEMWFAPALSHDPATGHTYLFGSDGLGRDLLGRAFAAGRSTLAVAFISTLALVVIGSLVGAIAGFYGGWLDTLLMRFTDFMLALPLLPVLLITIRWIKEAAGRTNPILFEPLFVMGITTLAFVLFGWMGLSRLVRGSILSLRSQPFIEAAKALGSSNRRIIFKHLLPNTLAPILVTATFAMGDFVVWEAVITYFRQGITDPPVASWGNMLVGAQGQIWFITDLNPFSQIRAYLVLLPVSLILVTVLSLNYIGDALRSALDPGESQG